MAEKGFSLTDAEVVPHESGGWLVQPVWAGVDRTRNGGMVLARHDVARRLAEAVMAGPGIRTEGVKADVNGTTYVSWFFTVLARQANADLRRLGF